MNNKKRNTIITCVVVGVILLVGIILFLLNYSVVDNGLSVLEKKWIADHANQIVDIQVYNDIPVYGYNGNGINFDFLNFFTERHKVSFNKVSYYTSSDQGESDFGFMVLGANQEVSDHDILFDMDHYVICAKDKNYHANLKNISKLGILKSDSKLLKKYFGDIEFLEYDDINGLVKALKNDEVSYVSIPNLQYMDKILENHFSIVTHLSDLKKKYVLRVKDKTIYEVMRKTYADYLDKEYEDDYSKNYLTTYFNAISLDDVSRKNYNSKVYHYGYVVNMPFENSIGDEFVGTLSNYLLSFEKLSFSEIEVKRYNNIDDLKSALVSGDIDFALGNFDYKNLNLKYVTSNTIRDIDYVVLSKNDYQVNSIKGFDKDKISVVSGSLLHQLCKDNDVDVSVYPDTDALLRSLDDSTIVLLDRETYQYYIYNKLKDYHVVLDGKIDNGYKFILNESNSTFNGLFQYYVDSVSYDNFMYNYRTNVSLDKDYTILKIVIFLITLVLFLAATIWFMNRKNVTTAVTKKEDRLKYIDPMTSLKNRSYLNKNIYSWDDNVIFPQGVVVFDLDNIKKVNDKFGREAGDEIIKKVASILINNQLENTDIIRSDGDEFIIYMVGYDEDKVSEHMKKLLKLMRDVPKCLGVNAGYSMIYDEVKTVDDAINEAILMMMKNKEIK